MVTEEVDIFRIYHRTRGVVLQT